MPSNIAADIDVAQAFLARWAANGALGAAVTGGITSDAKPSPKTPPTAAPKRPVMPYAQLVTAPGPKANEYSSDKSWIDYRRVTVSIWHTNKERLGAIVGTVQGVFDNKPLDFAGINDSAKHMRTEPLTQSIVDDKTKVDGNDVYKATVEWCVWTHRQPAT